MVSVCMATFDGAPFVEAQLASILASIADQDEVVVVDDCSRDDTVRRIEAFGDSRIRVIRNRVNSGVVASFEVAIRHARGSVIFLSDQDDVWYPEKRDRMVQAMKNTDVLAVVCDCRLVDEADAVICESYFEMRGSGGGVLRNLYKNSYLGCAMCFSSALLPRLLPFPKGIVGHDEWIGLMAASVGKVHFMREILMDYRRHSRNVSSMRWGGPTYALRKRLINGLVVAKRLVAVKLGRK